MSTLRAVKDDEKAAISVSSALEGGDKRAELVALRKIVSSALLSPKTHPRDISPLTRRQQELSEEIRMLDSEAKGDDIGEAASTPDEEFAVS